MSRSKSLFIENKDVEAVNVSSAGDILLHSLEPPTRFNQSATQLPVTRIGENLYKLKKAQLRGQQVTLPFAPVTFAL